MPLEDQINETSNQSSCLTAVCKKWFKKVQKVIWCPVQKRRFSNTLIF